MNEENRKVKINIKLAYFNALCLFLSAIEFAIPKPLPFLRIGLANLPVLIAIKFFDFKTTICLILLKTFTASVLSGTIFSYIFVFSFIGSLSSGIIMYLVSKTVEILCKKSGKKLISNIGISLTGAFANNISQAGCAKLMMFGENARYIIPVLLINGLITGLLLGIFTNLFEEKSEWIKTISNKSELMLELTTEKFKFSKEYLTFFICVLVLIAFLVVKSVPVIWAIVLIFLVINIIRSKGKVKIIPSLIIVASITILSLLTPSGKVLFNIGSFKITQDALFNGLQRSGKLIGMVFISKIAVSKKLCISGKYGVYLEKMLSIFNKLNEKKIEIKKGKIIAEVDKRLLEIWNEIQQ